MTIVRWLCFRPCYGRTVWVRLRRLTVTQSLILLLIFCVISLCVLSYYATDKNHITKQIPHPGVVCNNRVFPNPSNRLSPNDHTSKDSERIGSKVLVLVETQYSLLGKDITIFLESVRYLYKVEIASRPPLPYLTYMDQGKYGIIIFEDFNSYLRLDKWNRELLDKYCLEFKVGVIGFMPTTERGLYNFPVAGFPLSIHTNLAMRDMEINPMSEILRITRAGEVYDGDLPGNDWTVFISNHTTYKPLAYSKTQISRQLLNYSADIRAMLETSYPVVMQDVGLHDGVQRVLFGGSLDFWLHRILLLDCISYLSHGKLSLPLDRYMMIDIDDIFVGKAGVRMKSADVQALVDSQTRLRHSIDGFRFNLGFSGKFFHRGTSEENKGDDLLLDYKQHFWWFGHTWGHTQAHLYTNVTDLEELMALNYQFAQEHDIPINTHYAVAPHHSGVYPVHDPLYEAWKKIWNIKVTSTEEYPHLRPARYRRGFIHRGIMVLPRQTCGLFTHTIFLDKYPKGRQRLEDSIRGGELFQTFLYNPMNIFMTHLSNYGNDRLALYTFESEIKFIECWTNLRLFTVPPLQLARMYFNAHPEEEDPVWGNPADDKRHLDIWPANKTCNKLPDFLVIGPQKTGTTALYTFLSMHPAIISNKKSAETFEEVQFFSGNNYYKGIDWYTKFFSESNTGKYVFEKSATYFDRDVVPRRVRALLPKAKLICILNSPAKRAYSWYQHMRAHNDKTALKYSFYEVITANESSPKPVRDLRSRCLNPGLYAHHLEHWLMYFPGKQMLILDGDELRSEPVTAMNHVEKFLHIEPYLNYTSLLRFDPKKGFYCQITTNNRTQCLGRSKGRQYPSMEFSSQRYLSQFYKLPNVALSKLLQKLGQVIPHWLKDDLAS